MKYKNIKVFSHNLTHSFMSFNNYETREYLLNLVKQTNKSKISIFWINQSVQNQEEFNQSCKRSIKFYKNWIPVLMKQHEIEDESVIELRTDIYLSQSSDVIIQAYAKDVNGKEYIQDIIYQL